MTRENMITRLNQVYEAIAETASVNELLKLDSVIAALRREERQAEREG